MTSNGWPGRSTAKTSKTQTGNPPPRATVAPVTPGARPGAAARAVGLVKLDIRSRSTEGVGGRGSERKAESRQVPVVLGIVGPSWEFPSDACHSCPGGTAAAVGARRLSTRVITSSRSADVARIPDRGLERPRCRTACEAGMTAEVTARRGIAHRHSKGRGGARHQPRRGYRGPKHVAITATKREQWGTVATPRRPEPDDPRQGLSKVAVTRGGGDPRLFSRCCPAGEGVSSRNGA